MRNNRKHNVCSRAGTASSSLALKLSSQCARWPWRMTYRLYYTVVVSHCSILATALSVSTTLSYLFKILFELW